MGKAHRCQIILVVCSHCSNGNELPMLELKPTVSPHFKLSICSLSTFVDVKAILASSYSNESPLVCGSSQVGSVILWFLPKTENQTNDRSILTTWDDQVFFVGWTAFWSIACLTVLGFSYRVIGSLKKVGKMLELCETIILKICYFKLEYYKLEIL